MKNFTTLAILIFTLTLGTTFSQPASVDVNIAANGQLPIGGFKPGLGLGGTGALEVGTFPGLALTARSGYIYHFQANHYTYFGQIPIMGGAKLAIPMSTLYVAGELGAVIVHSRRDDGGPLDDENVSSDDTHLGWDVGIGSKVESVDLRLSFNVLNAQDITDNMTLGLSIGVDL